ncbi:MAG TPA: hypothetical protein VNA69_09365 [Thermoanaerobaculia bacterium]|nr:hypothetical protein [Thermoanaerobaculia bacterium]
MTVLRPYCSADPAAHRKRQLDKNRRSTGENLAVMWPGETTKRCATR